MNAYLSTLTALLFPPPLPSTYQQLFDETEARLTKYRTDIVERAEIAAKQVSNFETQCKQLSANVKEQESKAENYLKTGERELALKALEKKQHYEARLVTAVGTLSGAHETSEQVQTAIGREEERLAKCDARLEELREYFAPTDAPLFSTIKTLYDWTMTPVRPPIDRDLLRKLVFGLLGAVTVLSVLVVALLLHH